MLKYLNGNKNNFQKKFEKILASRKIQNSVNSPKVKKIIEDVKKNGDYSIIKLEKKFSNIKKLNKNMIKFNKSEINTILKKLDLKTLI